MAAAYRRFLKYVPDGGSIADLGCGSGRDSLWFRQHGYEVSALDASPEMCRLAAAYAGVKVQCCTLQDWQPAEKYDGLWACASLLHLREQEIYDFFARKKRCLKPGGVIFASLKTAVSTGNDGNGRYFCNFTEAMLQRILRENADLRLLELWHAGDGLGRDVKWICFVVGAGERKR